MKYKIIAKTIAIAFLLFYKTIGYSQTPTLVISDVKVNNQPITGNYIDFGSSESVTVYFKVQFTKPENLSLGEVSYVAGTNKNSGWSQLFTPQYLTLGINNTGFTDVRQYTLYASDYSVNSSDNYLMANVVKTTGNVQYQSNKIYIKKDPVFTLTPPTVSIPCGDTSARTFTVTPANIPAGANVTYQWSYNNWTELSGSTTTSRTLQPSSGSVLPSSVSVTPYINGVAQTTKTSTVSRASFTAGSLSISGSNYVCDTGQYTINDLPSYISIQSVGSSNTNVATVSLTGSNQITVTKVSDGLATITVLLQNSCSQTTTISKQIQVGIPASASNGTISGANYICNNQTYTYTVNGASHPCITSYTWEVSPNLSIISQDVNSITVVQNTVNAAYAGNIKYKIPGSTIEISKSIWVGLPNNNELSIDKIGAYDFYVGTWTKLKASYQTLIYVNSGEYNFTYEWQIPNSLIRNYTDTAYKDVNPNYSGQLNIGVRAWNECGCSDWKYQLFSVGGGSGNNELTPMKP